MTLLTDGVRVTQPAIDSTALHVNRHDIVRRATTLFGGRQEGDGPRGRERSTSSFHDFQLSRGISCLEPTLDSSPTALMEGQLRDPVYRRIVWAPAVD